MPGISSDNSIAGLMDNLDGRALLHLCHKMSAITWRQSCLADEEEIRSTWVKIAMQWDVLATELVELQRLGNGDPLIAVQ